MNIDGEPTAACTIGSIVVRYRPIRWPVLAWIVLLCVLAVQPLRAAPAPSAAHPNIVFILTDDMEVSQLPFMRNLNALVAAEGVGFERAYVNVALCCPSRATILTGKYAQNTGVWTDTAPAGGFDRFHELGHEQKTIAVWLEAAGYRTALFGKYLNHYPDRADGGRYVPSGWTEWAADLWYRGDLARQFNYVLNKDGALVRHGSRPTDYATDVLGRLATDFITTSAAARKPFFLYLALPAPHAPAVPAPRHAGLFPNERAPRPPSFNEADVSDKPPFLRRPPLTAAGIAAIDRRRRDQLRSLQAVDEVVRSIVDTLARVEQLARTYIVFTSDNGLLMGQHRRAFVKDLPYEEAQRVPLLVRGPGVVRGVKRRQLVTNADLAPTFLAWAGVRAPLDLDGRSFAPLLRRQAPHRWRIAVPLARHDRQAPTDLPGYRGLRTRRYTYVEWQTGARELYDTDRDPYQLVNIARDASPALLAGLATATARLARCRGAGCRAAEDAPW
ncbi:sulfatase [Benzoatithermus flavus]|uniref:Sulfatase n=1 Tax=Benzoatithermus flavus TaxID=3108223 RepID=A0ABU8XUR7_9PROT